MGHSSVPADRGDSASLVEVGLPWLELGRFLQVLGDILDQDLRSATCEEIFLVRVELHGFDRHVLVDRCRRDASFTHELLRFVCFADLADVPERDGSVSHAASHDAELIDLIDPVQRGEFGRTLGAANHL